MNVLLLLLEANKTEGLKPRKGKVSEWMEKGLFSDSKILTGAQVNKRIKTTSKDMGFNKGKEPYGEVHVPSVNAFYDPSRHSVGIMSGFVHHDRNTKYNIPAGVIEHEVGHSRMAGKDNSKIKRGLHNAAYTAGALASSSPILVGGVMLASRMKGKNIIGPKLWKGMGKGIVPATVAGAGTVLGYEGDADRRVRNLYKKRGLSTKEANKKVVKELGPAYGSYVANAGILTYAARKASKAMR